MLSDDFLTSLLTGEEIEVGIGAPGRVEPVGVGTDVAGGLGVGGGLGVCDGWGSVGGGMIDPGGGGVRIRPSGLGAGLANASFHKATSTSCRIIELYFILELIVLLVQFERTV